MKRSRRIKSRTFSWCYLLVTLVVFMVGVIASYLYFKPKLAIKVPFIEDIKSQSIKELPKEDTSLLPQEPFIPFIRTKEAIKKYLEPYNGEVLDVYSDESGIVYVNLSGELRRNFSGDALEEYTLIVNLFDAIKENLPWLTSMRILIGGKNVESLGGHIDISRPIGEEIKLGGIDAS